MRLTQIVEALLFASDAPLGAPDIARIDERLDEDTVEAVIQELRSEYEETERAFQIYEVAGGYQLLTRPDFATYLERYETVPQPAKLSAPALETLAIISYRQPIGRGEVEEIRGVGSSSALKTLLDRGLVEVVGRGEGLGRPLLYGTSTRFLEHFGFRSLEDLPRPDELPVVLRTRSPVVPVLVGEEDVVALAEVALAEVDGKGRMPEAPALEQAIEASTNGAGPEPVPDKLASHEPEPEDLASHEPEPEERASHEPEPEVRATVSEPVEEPTEGLPE
jgi:segregation and condensation protein B